MFLCLSLEGFVLPSSVRFILTVLSVRKHWQHGIVKNSELLLWWAESLIMPIYRYSTTGSLHFKKQ